MSMENIYDTGISIKYFYPYLNITTDKWNVLSINDSDQII